MSNLLYNLSQEKNSHYLHRNRALESHVERAVGGKSSRNNGLKTNQTQKERYCKVAIFSDK
jgi:hypothetical protein